METAICRVRARSARRRENMAKRRATPDRVFRGPSDLQFGPNGSVASLGGESALNHNRGEPYAAARPISQRIAGQPIQVAEVVHSKSDGKGRKSHPAPRPGRRRLSIEEMAKLPKWVRKRLALPTEDDRGKCVKSIKAMHSDAVRVDILESHPVLDLLHRPNPRMNLHTLLATTVTSLQFSGQFFWWLSNSKDRNRPFDMWYIPSKRVQERPGNVMLTAGYQIVSDNTDGATSETVTIPAKFMIYAYIPDPDNPMKPYATAEACVQAIRVDEAISTCQQQTFENGIFPALAFVTGEVVDPTGKSQGKLQMERSQLDQLQTRLEQLFKGPSKHGKSIVLDRLIDDVKFLSHKPHEMDWQNSSSFNRDRIWRVFGTPRVIAGDIQDANRATAMVADEAVCGNVINPLATMISQVMNDQLLPRFTTPEENLVMWIEEAGSVDRDAKTKELELLLANRGLMVDELRAELGMPPLPNDMGRVLVSTAMQVFEPIDGTIDDREEYLNLDDDSTTIDADAESVQQDGKSYRSTAHKDFATAWLKIHGRNEKIFAAEVQKFLLMQARGVLGKLKMQLLAGETPNADELFDPREWDEALLKMAMPQLLRASVVGAVNLLRSVKGRKDAVDEFLLKLPPQVVEQIRGFLDDTLSKPYWGEINDTTKHNLSDALTSALERGETPQQTVARVRNALAGTKAESRARMIARSETTAALNGGAQAAIDDLKSQGIASGSEWLAVLDQHTRHSHVAASGQKSDKNGMFDIGGHPARFPGDPDLPAEERCNCILPGMIIEGDVDAATRSFYAGESLEIVMSSGRRLAVTPNHSVLSEDGFVRAGSLKKGQNLFAYRSEVEPLLSTRSVSTRKCVNYEPAAIEKIFASLRLSGLHKVTDRAAVDFHGDEKFINGNVEIVWTDGILLVDGESCAPQHCRELSLVAENSLHFHESRNRPLGLNLVAVGAASPSLPCRSALTSNELAALLERLPFKSFGLGLTARRDAMISENDRDGCSRLSGVLGDSIDGPAGLEFLADVRKVHSFGTLGQMGVMKRLGSCSQRDAFGSDDFLNGRDANAELLRQGIGRSASHIFLDKIVSINRRYYAGHVYDLQSPHGIIVAGGICISNCRCTLLTVLATE